MPAPGRDPSNPSAGRIRSVGDPVENRSWRGRARRRARTRWRARGPTGRTRVRRSEPDGQCEQQSKPARRRRPQPDANADHLDPGESGGGLARAGPRRARRRRGRRADGSHRRHARRVWREVRGLAGPVGSGRVHPHPPRNRGLPQSPLRANGRSTSKRKAVSLERCMLTIISCSSVVLPGEQDPEHAPVR
jgi:hypothetical protein